MRNILTQTAALIFFILISFAAGGIGSITTVDSLAGWYQFLIKPPLTPPDWIFGPVWTLLYALMGIATYLVWRSSDPKKWRAIGLFITHLIVNATWSLIYFGEQSIFFALLIIILLDVLVAWIILHYWRISKIAAYLLIPYLLWILFATYLNAGILLLN